MEFPTPGKRRKSTERCSYNCITSASSVRALTSHHSDSEFDIIRMYSCFMWTKHLLPFMWTKHLWYPTRIDNSKDSAVIETRLYRPPRSSQGRVTSEQRFQAHDWVVQNKWTVQGPKPYYLDMHRSKVQAHTFTKRCVFFEPTELVLLILVWSRHLRLPCPVWRLGLRLNYHSINLKIEDLVSITGVKFSESRTVNLSFSPSSLQRDSHICAV